MALWEKSIKLKGNFPTSRRNLALAYAKSKNPMRDLDYCVCLMQKALDLDPTDSRVFFELAELWRDSGKPLDQIVKDCEKHLDLVLDRDDACIALCADLNCIGRHEDALKLILGRKFHPWEGGEGKVTTQHKEARLGLARQLIAKGKNEEAVSHLLQALEAKESFGEGTLPGTPENNIRYCLGLAYEKLDPELSRKNYELASGGQSEPAAAIYYNDQPPHMVFYQGLAFLKLGEEAQAKSRFNKLVAFARKNMLKAQRYDFFAVSLPDFGILDVDLDQRNKIHCAYMMALGKLGLGEFEEAKRLRESVLEMSPGHAGISLNFDPYLKGELS
jgi:tetratricopeptide (TPR) repeat protein